MARVLNLLIVILEIIGFSKSLSGRSIKRAFIFYTQISNLIAFIASLLFVFLGPKSGVEILRYISVCMLVMTFLVTVFVLVPMTGKAKELLFSGSGLFHHLLVPVISTISYMALENRVKMSWAWIVPAITLIYGIIMLYLNYQERIEGPYPFFMIKKIGAKITLLWVIALMVLVCTISLLIGYHKPMKTNAKFIFVHGLSGWGNYDLRNEFIPYWGLTGGDIIRYMNEEGYESYAASVDPTGSAWDRACELYAQLTGTRVDYGAAHSQKAGHERYGKDYSKNPLLKDFNGSDFILIGHSFGGATIRLFSEIIRNGDKEEIAFTDSDDLSDFFRGGGGKNLLAVVTLAAPTNGTTAYDLYEDPDFDVTAIEVDEEYLKNGNMVSTFTKADLDGRESWDYASFDMHIDNALELNRKITTFDDVYYLAYPCASTIVDENGEVNPDPDKTETIFMKGAIYMSKYTGTTAGGFYIDESWRANDGLVNEESAKAPIGSKSLLYEEGGTLSPGVWYVMPTFTGDHMSLQGGLTKRINVRPFYAQLAQILESLPEHADK